jgi:hypothetical protein
MAPNKISSVTVPARVDEIAWRHVWLTKLMIGNAGPERIFRPRTITKMTPARRLERLRRLRAILEPPRGSWLDTRS